MIEGPSMQVVRVGPTLGERIADRRRVVTRTLARFRKRLQHDAQPEPWAELELPAGLVLADICDALGLSEEQRGEVLGEEGAAFVGALQETHISA